MRQRAEDALAELVRVNRALAGGDGYRELQQSLTREIKNLSEQQP